MESEMKHDMGSTKTQKNDSQMKHNHYPHLLLMIFLSFIAMYILMYVMVDSLDNVYPNVNQFYMAGLMSAPMLILELTIMGGMYKNKKLNMILIALSAVGLIFFYLGVRQQIGVADRQFLKSMIPHHASALLMCQKATIEDPEIKDLCKNILAGQQSEIDLMKSKLKDLKK